MDVADRSALVQQCLLLHGARYVTRATEDTWKRVPVTLHVPPGSAVGCESPSSPGRAGLGAAAAAAAAEAAAAALRRVAQPPAAAILTLS